MPFPISNVSSLASNLPEKPKIRLLRIFLYAFISFFHLRRIDYMAYCITARIVRFSYLICRITQMQQLKLETNKSLLLILLFSITIYTHTHTHRDNRTTFQIFSVKLAAITRRNIRIAKTSLLPLSPPAATSWPTDWLIMTNPVDRHTHTCLLVGR